MGWEWNKIDAKTYSWMRNRRWVVCLEKTDIGWSAFLKLGLIPPASDGDIECTVALNGGMEYKEAVKWLENWVREHDSPIPVFERIVPNGERTRIGFYDRQIPYDQLMKLVDAVGVALDDIDNFRKPMGGSESPARDENGDISFGFAVGYHVKENTMSIIRQTIESLGLGIQKFHIFSSSSHGMMYARLIIRGL